MCFGFFKLPSLASLASFIRSAYKNNAGTATLGTDLKVYFTCNGGTNWTESTPTAAGTFSTGILMAKCPEVTCTSGTDVRYKVVWANQALASKETQLHGIGMNY